LALARLADASDERDAERDVLPDPVVPAADVTAGEGIGIVAACTSNGSVIPAW